MPTTNYNFTLPTIGGSTDTWGQDLNTQAQQIDTEIKRVDDAVIALQAIDISTYALLSGAAFTGSVTAPNFAGNFSGNATTATRLATPRTITFTGGATGSFVFDGSANVNVALTVPNAGGGGGSNGPFPISAITGLQTALNAKQDTLPVNQRLPITYGTAAPPSTLAEGHIYLQHEP